MMDIVRAAVQAILKQYFNGVEIMRMLFRAICLAVCASSVLASVQSSAAQACPFNAPQDFKIFRKAQIILRAKVVSYVAKPKEYRAFFEFRTVEVVLGRVRPVPKTWKAAWTNSTFGEPMKWKNPMNVIVGLGATIDLDGQPILIVMQQSCSSPSIIVDTPENLRALLKDAGIFIGKYQ